ncbi:DUF4011 domain-containing protein [Accumulibacter sp.]|uniref:DUF4011 domain-containing protein n=2 Tax=Accumulibacter sp. TaxID=2053492 RepID=UPI002D1FB288|nr:DUF4011 domain-containing protein [Accumulibacter sp.]
MDQGQLGKQPLTPLRIDAELIAKLNLADFENAVPMLRELSIVNDADEALESLELRIESTPAFLQTKVWQIEALGACQRYRISDVDVRLDAALLSRLTEAETAAASIVLYRRGDTACELARLERCVQLLPRNQWGGLSQLPEMVAAFVQPNDPAVERLLKQSTEVLRRNDRNPALNGYQGGPRRAWEISSGIWSAVAAMGLDYALPPASFEYSGQKVRGPTQLAELGLANCLDLALLFSSALEQAGLNPLLVFTKGHAFVGVWLKPEEFSSSVVDDVSALRKRVKLKELLLFESTLVTQRPAPAFSYAVQCGEQNIVEEGVFELAVDIRRARLQRIKPLASVDLPSTATVGEPPAILEPAFAAAPELPDEDISGQTDPATLKPADRLARWQRKLLDLSLRNKLLNFRSSKQALTLEAPDAAALEDRLSEMLPLKLLPRPELMDGADPRNLAIHEAREREDLRRQHALDALQRREIFVAITDDELDSRLVDLYRTARSTLQEGGANTLFLALGFLCWSRDEKGEQRGEQRIGQRYRAPLLLVPVTLNRRSVRSGFTLTLHDDEPRFNPTLIEMLRQDFKLSLGVADGELPRDQGGLDVAAIWRSVSQAIKDIKGWEVSEEVVLSMFSFAKHLMWKDLSERAEQLRNNPVVRHLIDTPRENYPAQLAFPDRTRLDREFAPEQIFCPLAADSSQLSAIIAAVRGKDFVLIGPPGTGKSQTIANLIAQCLAEGKRVLFVSEKMAALDMVYRRMREVGLGEFCLELHSSKARKLDVLAQLQAAWTARGCIDADAWRVEAQRLQDLRDQLNVYVERLHLQHPNGMTIYRAIGRVLQGEGGEVDSKVPLLTFSWHSADAHDAAAMSAMRELTDRLQVNAQAVGQTDLRNGPLAVVGHADWSPSWQQAFIETVRDVQRALHVLQNAAEHFCHVSELPCTPLDRRRRSALGILARILPQAAGHDWRFVLRTDTASIVERLQAARDLLARHREISGKISPPWPEAVVSACWRGLALLQQRREIFTQIGEPWSTAVVEDLQQGLRLLTEIRRLSGQLSVVYNPQVEQLNVAQLQRDWVKAEQAMWPMSWLAKRRIHATLQTVLADTGEPEIAGDLLALARIRSLRAQVQMLAISDATDGVWAGLGTRPEYAECALDFQQVLRALHIDQPCSRADRFPAIADGHCGSRLARQLQQLYRFQALDAELQTLDSLGSPTERLWAGFGTRPELLTAALHFQSALQAIRESGKLVGEHASVARGHCGTTLAADHRWLEQRACVEEQLDRHEDLRGIGADLWNGLQTRIEQLDQALKFQVSVAAAIAKLTDSPDEVTAVKVSLQRLLGDNGACLDPAGPVAGAADAYLDACGALPPAISRLCATGGFAEGVRDAFADIPLEQLDQRCTAILRSANRLHAWCAWRNVGKQAQDLGLAPLVTAIEKGEIAPGTLRHAFEINYSRWWLNAVVDEEPVIRGFVAAEHEQRINDFRTLDERFTELTRARVRAGLCAALPTQDGGTRSSEWGILRHEIHKKKRHLPLRELIRRIPTALTQLTPCLLMSPLSIAQYLTTDASTFDLVVFDEASQIPVWDAIGAIARGRQVVMVGDPRQLPPTNFFDRAESEFDEEDVEADLESILDECIGANLPTMNLAWHYRSRHESLIAFSNHRYYGGSLVTFPSPVTTDHAVSFHHVDQGVYEKGGARINKPEAKALVADLVERLQSPGFRESRLTIGVVTFNAEQQALIEDLLDEERRRDPSIEPHFADAELEPVFVKNLESVQGDERDIVYFSITYGPDHTGVVSMNFGPMNRTGGERRLNVAITRARHELRIFSSLRAEQMNLARTQAIGVRDLKHFLDFAERGVPALATATTGSLGSFESPFEEAVAAALTRQGWELHTQVGASAFRVDLAVVHPDAQGVYLSGIECDGATYHRAATARDRDKLREQVLRGLGWEILRVWSTDWWIDAAGTLEKIDTDLRRLLAKSRSRRATKAVATSPAASAAVVGENAAADVRPESVTNDQNRCSAA